MERTQQQQLLIDYSKNTAPLQTDGGRERLQVGMSIKYHEPLMGQDELMDLSANSLGGSSKGHQLPPNPSFPLQFLEQVEKGIIMLPKEQVLLMEDDDNDNDHQQPEEDQPDQEEEDQQHQEEQHSSSSPSPKRGRQGRTSPASSPTRREKQQSKSPVATRRSPPRRTRSKSLSKSPSRSPRRSRSKSQSRSPARRGLSPRRAGRSPRRKNNNRSLITFKVPPKATVRRRGGRFQTQKSYHDLEDSILNDFLMNDKSNHTMPASATINGDNVNNNMRSSIISNADTLTTIGGGTVNTFGDESTIGGGTVNTFADESTNDMSIRTAPAAIRSSSALPQNGQENPRGRESLEKKLRAMSPPPSRKKLIQEEGKENLDDDDEDSEDEKNNSSASFLPTGLTSSEDEESDDKRSTLRRTRSKKKKQQPSLDEWFHKGDATTSRSTRSLRRSKTPTRSNRRKQHLTLDDAGTRNRTRQNSLGSQTSFSSQLNDNSSNVMGQSYPTGPRSGRVLPPRTKSFDFDDHSMMSSSLEPADSSRSLISNATNASTSTRRGGRKKGNRNNNNNGPRRGGIVRSLSSADVPSGSYRNLKSIENSCSFMAGSRIRVRRTGTSSSNNNHTDTATSSGASPRPLLGRHQTHPNADDDASETSSLMILPPNPPTKQTTTTSRRGILSRTKSCEGMPSLVRPS